MPHNVISGRGQEKSELMCKKKLPDSELDVLASLWQHGEMTVSQMRDALDETRPMTHAALSTLLKRLKDKGLVSRRKGDKVEHGKAFLFRATVAQNKTSRGLVADLVNRVFGGDGMALVTALFQDKPPTPAQLDQLQQMLDELRKKQSKRGR